MITGTTPTTLLVVNFKHDPGTPQISDFGMAVNLRLLESLRGKLSARPATDLLVANVVSACCGPDMLGFPAARTTAVLGLLKLRAPLRQLFALVLSEQVDARDFVVGSTGNDGWLRMKGYDINVPRIPIDASVLASVLR